MTENGFEPASIIVDLNTVVIFENKDTRDRWPASNIHPTHSIYPEFDPKKPLNPGASWQFKFEKAGIWRYHDHLYPEFSGEIKVEDSQNQPQTKNGSNSQNVIERFIAYLKNSLSKLTQTLFGPNIKASISEQTESKYIFNDQINQDTEAIFTNENELYSYVKKFGFEKTISALVSLTAKFGDCHETAHKAGRFAFEIYGNQVFAQPAAPCHSGGYHGATEAFFAKNGTASLANDLKTICSSAQNAFFSHQCLHGIGHGLMAWSNYDLPQTLTNCELLEKDQESCFTGAFMENIVAGINPQEGHNSKFLSTDPQFPCNAIDVKYQSSCYFLQTSRMIAIFGPDFQKIANECSNVPQTFQQSCFGSMGRDVGGVTRGRPAEAIKNCSNAPDGQHRLACLSGAVQDTFWVPEGQDEAIAFCKLLKATSQKNVCYATIIPRAPEVIFEKANLVAFCNKLERGYIPVCLNLLDQN